jgi:hypothetical protein
MPQAGFEYARMSDDQHVHRYRDACDELYICLMVNEALVSDILNLGLTADTIQKLHR